MTLGRGFAIFLSISYLLLAGACAVKTSSSGGSQDHFGGAFGEKCNPVTYVEPTVVHGRAVYQRRESKTNGLGEVESTQYPIRHAEAYVMAGNGLGGEGVIQCGPTDADGKFNLPVPRNSSSVTVLVASRGDNDYVKARIMDTPSGKKIYSVRKAVILNGAPTFDAELLVAPAKGTLEGGAFNIFDQVLKANEFLRTATEGAFTVAPSVAIFWKAGVNPGSYVGVSGGISFFDPNSDQLFILGGIGDDTDHTDTDHFDNSVIIHEYGHFLENHFAKSDSPGGSHDANSIIDPRLAWSEGWANFISVAVSGDPIYRDTFGNSDGTTGIYFSTNMETGVPPRDIPQDPGEGNFREFSITRAMWDAIDPHPVSSAGTNESGTDDATMPFKEFWSVFATPELFPSPDRFFRNYGLFMELRETLTSKTPLGTIFSKEKQKASREDYGAAYTPRASPCTWSMSTTGSGETGSFEDTNLLTSNDFYFYQHPGGLVSLKIERTAGSGDLDLYVYKDEYTFGDMDTVAGFSNEESPQDGGDEVVAASLPAGPYLINVYLFTALQPASASYQISVNGSYLCP